jgi:hypothetical protein
MVFMLLCNVQTLHSMKSVHLSSIITFNYCEANLICEFVSKFLVYQGFNVYVVDYDKLITHSKSFFESVNHNT